MSRRFIPFAVLIMALGGVSSAHEAPESSPENLRVRYHKDSEGMEPGDPIWQCEDSSIKELAENGNYDFIWDAMLADELPAVDGYQYRLYKNYHCEGIIRIEGEIETAEDPEPEEYPTEYGFTWSPSTPARYCWKTRAFNGSDITKTPEPPEYGPWSPCCCLDVVEVCNVLTTPHIIDIGGEACGRRIEDPTPELRWINVARERGYRVEVRNSENILVIQGTTGKDETTVNLDRLPPGEYTARVRAFGDNERNCDSEWSTCSFRMAPADEADFSWWPAKPKAGQRVRCTDETTGSPQWWHWTFGDGGASEDQSPTWSFDEPGTYDVSMMVGFESGKQTATKSIPIAGIVSCGDGQCEGRETAWSCPADCGLETAESARSGGRDHRPSIPIAVGGVEGVGGTFWKTAGSLYNPGDEVVTVVLEYSPLNSGDISYAGPFRIPAKQGLYWDNMLVELFRTAGNGSLWVDASGPVIFSARSYNNTKEGDFGQGLTGVRERLTLARGEGKVYLAGLREDEVSRTNLFFQEVDGLPITVRVEVFDGSGKMLGRTDLDIKGHSAVRRSLRRLGASGISSAYATAQVRSGDGRMAATGSVIDQINGDPTTVDPLHKQQVLSATTAKTAADEDHQLVAVIAHTRGLFQSKWRSEVAIVNPTASVQTVRLEYTVEYDETGVVGKSVEASVKIQPGEQKTWTDVLGELFELPEGARTQGALHLYSPDGVIVHSRTFNQQADTSTKGQTMPALKAADLIPVGETGQIVGLRHTDGTRTNLGLAAFADSSTEVEISFFTTRLTFFHLGTLTETVKAKSHLQVTRIFEKLGLTDEPMTDIVAYVNVKKGGSVYAYGSVVDNGTGDATTYLTARQ